MKTFSEKCLLIARLGGGCQSRGTDSRGCFAHATGQRCLQCGSRRLNGLRRSVVRFLPTVHCPTWTRPNARATTASGTMALAWCRNVHGAARRCVRLRRRSSGPAETRRVIFFGARLSARIVGTKGADLRHPSARSSNISLAFHVPAPCTRRGLVLMHSRNPWSHSPCNHPYFQDGS